MNPHPRARSGEQGLTLVEVSVSVLVVAVGLLSVLAVFPVGLRWSGDIRNSTLLPHVAETVANWQYENGHTAATEYARYAGTTSTAIQVESGNSTGAIATTGDFFFVVTQSDVTTSSGTIKARQFVLDGYRRHAHMGTTSKRLGSFSIRLYENGE